MSMPPDLIISVSKLSIIFVFNCLLFILFTEKLSITGDIFFYIFWSMPYSNYVEWYLTLLCSWPIHWIVLGIVCVCYYFIDQKWVFTTTRAAFTPLLFTERNYLFEGLLVTSFGGKSKLFHLRSTEGFFRVHA